MYIFILENIIYMILSYLGTLFGCFSIVCFFDLNYIFYNEILIAKLFCVNTLHNIIFWICLGLIVHSCKLCSMINRVRSQLKLLNDNMVEKPIMRLMFTYKGLDMKEYILDELEMPGYPRNAFFAKRISNNQPLNNQQIPVVENQQIKNQQIIIDEKNQIIQNNNVISLNVNQNNNIGNNSEKMEENNALNNNDDNKENTNKNN